jgi:hypothetical protein
LLSSGVRAGPVSPTRKRGRRQQKENGKNV